jgi:hypothetical protein
MPSTLSRLISFKKCKMYEGIRNETIQLCAALVGATDGPIFKFKWRMQL